MKKPVMLIVFSTVVLTVSTVLAEKSIEFEMTADFYSKYIWRGQNINDDYAFQTGLSATYKHLTASVWGNLDLTEINNNRGEFTEWDYSLDYSDSIGKDGKIGYSVGIINYHFPGVVGDTTEFYWGLSLDVPLSPSLTVYHDIDNVEGTYACLGLSHAIENITKSGKNFTVDLELGASLGWGNSSYNRAYWSVDESKLNDLAFSLALPVELGGGWTVTPSFNYVTLVNDDIRDSDAFGTDSDFFFTGISISKSF